MLSRVLLAHPILHKSRILLWEQAWEVWGRVVHGLRVGLEDVWLRIGVWVHRLVVVCRGVGEVDSTSRTGSCWVCVVHGVLVVVGFLFFNVVVTFTLTFCNAYFVCLDRSFDQMVVLLLVVVLMMVVMMVMMMVVALLLLILLMPFLVCPVVGLVMVVVVVVVHLLTLISVLSDDMNLCGIDCFVYWFFFFFFFLGSILREHSWRRNLLGSSGRERPRNGAVSMWCCGKRGALWGRGGRACRALGLGRGGAGGLAWRLLPLCTLKVHCVIAGQT